MIYMRDQEDKSRISQLNIVFKGSWKMSSDDVKEDFIYKKISESDVEDLLTEYYCKIQ